MKAVSGRLADVRRRRPLVAWGYGISSVAKLGIGAATGWPLVLAARLVDRTGKGLRGPPRDALIADDTPTEDRGRAFGFHRAADTAGAVVGPLAGLGLYEALDHHLRPLFFVSIQVPSRAESEGPPLSARLLVEPWCARTVAARTARSGSRCDRVVASRQ